MNPKNLKRARTKTEMEKRRKGEKTKMVKRRKVERWMGRKTKAAGAAPEVHRMKFQGVPSALQASWGWNK